MSRRLVLSSSAQSQRSRPLLDARKNAGFDTPSLALLFRPDEFNDKEIIINTNIMLETKQRERK